MEVGLVQAVLEVALALALVLASELEQVHPHIRREMLDNWVECSYNWSGTKNHWPVG